MLLLASGSFGSAANATIFTKDFGSGGGSVVNLDITSTGAYLVGTADEDSKYENYSVTFKGGDAKKGLAPQTTNYYFLDSLQRDGSYASHTDFSADSRIGTATDLYTGGQKSTLGRFTVRPNTNEGDPASAAIFYSQLCFDLDGTTTYGVAAVQNMQFKSVCYEVTDAVAPVPEPAVWAEMIAGLGAAGVVMRRRRAARTLAA